MAAEQIQDIAFGADSGDAHYLGSGWSAAEPGFRWMIGAASDLWLNNPGPGDAFVLQMEVAPFCHAPTLPAQRLVLEVRGTEHAHSLLEENGWIAYRLPAAAMQGPAPVHVVFRHPDAARPVDHGHPNDTRPLALAVKRLRLLRVTGDASEASLPGGRGITQDELAALTGLPAARFMQQFESLGDNCEFGLVQRRCEAEPLSLLRFSNLGLRQLIWALERQFDGLGDIANLQFWTDDSARREYVLRDTRFGLTFHTFLYHGDVDESRLLQQQSARMRLLRRKLLEDLANGEKIFVAKRNTPAPEQEILALYAALSRLGPNTLLWVAAAEAAHAPGSVERLLPGLLRGYIDRFAPYDNAHDLSLGPWLTLCVNARRLVPLPVTEPA